jgi:CubicO group peptidase (beta-lactamase class C family)
MGVALACAAHAEADKSELRSLFGYARGTPDTSMQEAFIVDAASNPEKVLASKRVARSGPAWELPRGTQIDPDKVRYAFKGQNPTLSEYLAKTRTTAMLVIKDGRIVFEKYQYDRTPDQRFLSFSMAKTVTAILVGIALEDGLILSLDDTVSSYVPQLRDSAYGKATIRQLLTMTSGVRWDDAPTRGDSDLLQLVDCHVRHRGCESSVALLAARRELAWLPGSRFNYSGGDTMVLGHVLRAATGMDVTAFMERRLWSRLGAEGDAAWMVDRQGVENVFGHFAATLRDYGRLGLLMANRGTARGTEAILTQKYWTEMTVAQLPASQPRVATSYFGYGYQLWLDPKPGVFCFRGLRGQAIYVDVPKQLVLVRLGVARADDTADSAERDYLWHGIRALY